MKSPRSILLVLIVLSSITLIAQVRVRVRAEVAGDDLLISNEHKSRTPVIQFPTPDIRKLMEEDEKDPGPFRFGVSLPANITLAHGLWTAIESGRLWTVLLRAPGAKSVNVLFDNLELGEASTLFVLSRDEKTLIGPITREFISPEKTFSTDLVNGHELVIAVFEPFSDRGLTQLHVPILNFGYKNLGEYLGFGDSAPCHNDIVCPEGNGWQEEGDAVAMVIVNGTRACSGTLINNACQDLTPNFLTAFHCLDVNANWNLEEVERNAVGNWGFRFQYESPTCGGIDDVSYSFFSGSQFRSASVQTDFALVQLNNRPGPSTGIKYAGWSRVNAAPTSSVGIHHPRGDVMKISIENDAATSMAWPGTNPNSHWRVSFDDGVVEHGSSGSPLFDQNGRVVGQLHGNQNNVCSSVDNNNCFCNQPIGEYGRFDVSWNGGGTVQTQLSAWLTNDPNVTMVNTITVPSVVGPALICTSGTFQVNEAPNTQISWSVSPSNIVTPSSGTGPTATVSKVSNGNGVITFNIGCGNPTLLNMSFHTGPYSSSDYVISGPSSASCNSYVYYNIPTLAGVTSINWIWPSNWTYVSGQGTPNLALRIKSSGPVYVGVNNTCGASGSYEDQFTYMSGTCVMGLSLHPNPTSQDLTLTLEESGDNPNNLYEIRIFNNLNENVFNTISNERELNISVRDFPIGTYILHCVSGDQIYRERFIVSR